MKRSWLILLGGLTLALAAYACIYLAGTARMRAIARSDKPTLAWMQQAYHLTDAQFAKLCELHDAYRPQCMARCAKIDAKNGEIKKMLAATNAVTPAIRQALADAAQIRAECEAEMLEHFYKVAQTMPPEQGRRYLEWIQRETLKTQSMQPGKSPADSPQMP